METGVIIKGVGGFYDVSIGSDEVIRCKARGKFRKEGVVPLVGDHVKINRHDEAIEEILPRKNQLVRPAVANIDYLGVVVAVTQPEPDFLLVDKLMISAEMNNIEPILIVNKIDLGASGDIQRILNMYSPTRYTVVPISCKNDIGLEDLKRALDKGVTTFAGQSGVGKSSIINKLCPNRDLEVGELSNRLQRGKHTTRHVELLVLPSGGMVVDTPGFSAIMMEELPMEELQYYYPEFAPYLSQCRFAGCIHYHEPRCKVKEVVEEGLISQERYERYIRILQEIKENRRDNW